MSEPLAVTGIGLVTALGYSAAASCAGARAGLSLARELAPVRVADPTTGEEAPVAGHDVRGLTEGYAAAGRLIRLCARALADLRDGLGDVGLERAEMFLALPGTWYAAEWRREVEAGEIELARGSAGDAPPPATLGSRELATLRRVAGLPAQLALHCFAGDETGFGDALRAAEERLLSGQAKLCIVGGVDSLVDEDALARLADLGLVKTTANPVGFAPGEAAGFLALERLGEARLRGAAVRARLGPVSAARESFHRCSGTPALGAALARAIERALATGAGDVGFVVGALNGDDYRARDWGSALVRLRPERDLGALPHWKPVMSFGQIGAAQGAASVALCASAFERGWAPARSALVWLSSDQGERAAFSVSAEA